MEIIFTMEVRLVAAADEATAAEAGLHEPPGNGGGHVPALGDDRQLPRSRVNGRHGDIEPRRGPHDAVAVGTHEDHSALPGLANHLLLESLTVGADLGKTRRDNETGPDPFGATFLDRPGDCRGRNHDDGQIRYLRGIADPGIGLETLNLHLGGIDGKNLALIAADDQVVQDDGTPFAGLVGGADEGHGTGMKKGLKLMFLSEHRRDLLA